MNKFSNQIFGFMFGVAVFFIGSIAGLSIFSWGGASYFFLIGALLFFSTSYFLNGRENFASFHVAKRFIPAYLAPFLIWVAISLLAFQNFTGL